MQGSARLAGGSRAAEDGARCAGGSRRTVVVQEEGVLRTLLSLAGRDFHAV